MIYSIFSGLIGVYCVFMGIRTLLTGQLNASEEKRIEGFSKKGARTYKKIYAATTIIGGLGVIAFGVLKILEEQKIMPENLTYKIVILGVVLVLAIILIASKGYCKKMTDDE